MRREIHRPDIEAVYDHYGLTIPGRDAGEWRKAQCPLPAHEDANPSASVNTDENLWACHACDEHGDSLDIIKEREGFAEFSDCVEFADRVFGSSGGSVRGQRRPGRAVPRKPGHRSAGGSWKPPWLRGGTGAGS